MTTFGPPFMLSGFAAATDIIGISDLNGLFTAHTIGNPVIWAARIIAHGSATISCILPVPVFMLVLLIAGVTARAFERTGTSSLLALLGLQLLELATFLLLSVAAGPWGIRTLCSPSPPADVSGDDGGTEFTRADRVEEHADRRSDDGQRNATDARLCRIAGWVRGSGHRKAHDSLKVWLGGKQ